MIVALLAIFYEFFPQRDKICAKYVPEESASEPRPRGSDGAATSWSRFRKERCSLLRQVPEADGFVQAAGKGSSTVGGEGDAGNGSRVALKATDLLGAGDIPDSKSRVRAVGELAIDDIAAAAGEDAAAIGRIGDGVDPSLVTGEAAQLPAAFRIPDAGDLVRAPTQNPSPR